MEKTKGFTLAEVLITLGIIGVVAALAMPVLKPNVDNSTIGPKLQKAKSTFETASEMMLNEEGVSSMLSIGSTGADIGDKLQSFMKISELGNVDTAPSSASFGEGVNINYTRYASDDGMYYYIGIVGKQGIMKDKSEDGEGNVTETPHFANIPNNQLIGLVVVDINGNRGPNNEAEDLFAFLLYNDGTLRPYGGRSSNRSDLGLPTWADGNCDTTNVANAATCTGSIFDNDMKVRYDVYSATAAEDDEENLAQK